ncbi:hypothetical protein JTB14_021148 [Gonioctena quinquepunctata]|nr:hypothetical protein JTB14_021148 [Gonioctena quinquepunctata]
MADVYKHFVLMQFLLVMLLMVESSRVMDGMKGLFGRKEYPDRLRHQWNQSDKNVRYILNRTLREFSTRYAKIGNGKNNKHVAAQTGSLAKLPCGPMPKLEKNMLNITVKWFKRNNISRDILTSWGETLLTDKRFLPYEINNTTNTQNWSLHIRYTKNSDAGLYQCQMCWNDTSDTCINNNVSLSVLEAHAKIFDGPTKKIPNDKELPLRLSCVLINSIEAPEYIFWYHDDRMINYDLADGATVRVGRQGSELIFPKANRTHAGNYSCVPSNAQLDSILVYYEDTAFPKSKDGSCGEKSQPRDDIVNMLVLISTFQLCR